MVNRKKLMQRTWGRELGGVTILVTLMLLVLMTLVAVAMSKNAFREVIITGTSRQGAQVRNLADTGVEWSVYWMGDDLNPPSAARPAPVAGTGAYALQALETSFVASQQTGMISSPITSTDMTLSGSGMDPSQRFQLYLTYMGNPRMKFTQSDVRATSISAASPGTVQLWSVRSEGYIEYSGGTSFIHRREAWLTKAPKAVQ